MQLQDDLAYGNLSIRPTFPDAEGASRVIPRGGRDRGEHSGTRLRRSALIAELLRTRNRPRPGAIGTHRRPAHRRREQHTGRSPLMSLGKHTGAGIADLNGSSP
ncbi:hypothetical protein GCM10023320_45570 [Pseudonocardia adelaidensis]|uniref:Uncharacterized protein n=1 Tax=Pseudonocardia adelaidensis TaxID=648754 RepID=A0ABP9NP78_9PSEU